MQPARSPLPMIWFLLGFGVGATVGALAMAVIIASGRKALH
jgi:hypothetical protein